MRKQKGQIVRRYNRWYVRYWERRNIAGAIQRKRVTHPLGEVTTRGRKPPADIKTEAANHMASVNNCDIPPEQIVSFAHFVTGIYLPWVKETKKPSTQKGYNDIWEHHLMPVCSSRKNQSVKLKTTGPSQCSKCLARSGRKTCRGTA